MTPFNVIQGDSPVILGQAHGGTWLPDSLLGRLNATGRALTDTDWHIARLYDGLLPGATVVKSNVHRYAIDANRDPARQSLYPGQNTTDLCPVTDFDGLPIWQAGQEPSEDEIETRRAAWHAPYHAALASEIARVKARHGLAILYDCHSIRSRIPYLFDGLLPVFNIGDNGGTTCAAKITAAVVAHCAASDTVTNGRFKGGWTTRQFGRPDDGVHAIQMELAQRAYLTAEAAPWSYDPAHAATLRPVLGAILDDLDRIGRSRAIGPTLSAPPTDRGQP